MIPKIVHQTWKTTQFDYWVFKKSQSSVREHLGDWDYRFWTDEELEVFVRDEYGEYFEAWKGLDRPIKRVDMARYFLLYRFGGLYADLDFIFTSPIDELIGEPYRLYFYRSQQALAKNWEFLGNAFMISAPGERFWMDLVEYQLALLPSTNVLHHTGPRAIGAFYEQLSDRSAIRVFGPDEFDNDRCADGVGAHRNGYHMRTATWQHPGFKA
jgi:mannosyltransferase OCH1-like enzyme